MQLKGLVRFFTIALILICLYQLSFTWFVHSHESKMDKKADAWVKANFPTAKQKYPGNKDLQDAYEDTLNMIKGNRVQRLLDSTKNDKIVLGIGTYQYAKQQELMLGLDLQGGISVTMEVGLDGLIKALANNTKDPAFNSALGKAVQRKANSGADLITLFRDEFKAANPNTPLAPFFTTKSGNRIKYDASDAEVVTYLRKEASNAFNNTFDILRTRIDRFGVASPNINKDENKSIINIELAGANDPERVRRYLQSTANLQFFEVYNSAEIGESWKTADLALGSYLMGNKKPDTASTSVDSTGNKLNDSTKGKTAGKNALGKTGHSSADSFPMSYLIQPTQGSQDQQTGEVHYPAAIALVRSRDTATLNSYFNLDFIKNKFPSNLVFMYGKVEDEKAANEGILQLYAIKTLANGNAELEGERVSDAAQDNDQRGRVAIKMTMDQAGSRIWAEMTKRNAPDKAKHLSSRPIAIVLDNFVYSAPFVQNEIPNGSSEITGSYTIQEAQDLARILKSGKLPAPARIVQEQVIGPTIGQEAVNGGSLAFLISFVIIFALMLVYYNTGGWVANIALILNLFFTVGILSALNATLTAAGIAGLVLTIGMAVDTNVIIFERIKEELTKGKGYLSAVNDGYRRSLAPVLDGHITTLLTAIILFYFGLGPVLGFATTQIIGLLLSLFCGILVSRLITDWYTNKQRHFEYFTSFSRKIFKHAQYKFIEYRKVAYGISVVVLLLGIGSFFNGFDQGVEFAGGRSYTIRFDKPQNVEAIRDSLKAKKIFAEAPIIKTVGSNSQLNITTAYLIHETGKSIDSAVEVKLYEGLKPFLAQGVSYNTFKSKRYFQGSQTVLPTISDDLKRGATYATLLALFAICLYIFIRFRDWRYSLGTIIALLHDVFVTLIVFSFLRKVVNFPLEIDQHFIAAILTVIGFSMNDTVIVFDRIREDSRLHPSLPKEAIINRAINETLSRTIMTSVTVFLTLLVLFIFGGEVTRGFAFAMLIGVFTGTYSSIFVAAPMLVDFAKNKPLGSAVEPKK